MMLPNIETFIGCESSFEEASIVLYGAPFDSTTSFRPGARFGPPAMRHESFAWRPTVRIRTEILWTSEYLTAEIWNFVLEAAKWHFQTLKREQKRY